MRRANVMKTFGLRREIAISPGIYINCIYLFSRIIFYIAGVRFDVSRLYGLDQIVDPLLLRERLFESIYYLHNQPPLFNLFIGLILKIFPQHYAFVFHIIYIALGLILTNSLFYLMTKMGVSTRISARTVILCVVSPPCLLYENWLFYTYPIVVLLLLSVLFLHVYIEQKNAFYGFMFFACLAFIALTRSVFHLVLFLTVAALMICLLKHKVKQILLIALLPFIVLLTLYLKNYLQFGCFSASSALGMHISKIAREIITQQEMDVLIQQNKITGIVALRPFGELEEYQTFLKSIPRAGIPILDQEYKSSRKPNLNHLAYVSLSEKYCDDSIAIIKEYPLEYMKIVSYGFYNYFLPSNYYIFIHANRMKINFYDRIYNIIVYGQFLERFDPMDFNYTKSIIIHGFKMLLHCGIFIFAAYCLIFWYSISYLIKCSNERNSAKYAVILFIILNMTYITLVCNAMEFGENQRYRFLTEPMAFVLIGVMLNDYRKRTE